MKIEGTSLKDAQDCNKGRGTKTNKIEFRIPADKQWIVESMTKFYYENGQILESNKNRVARLALNLLAKNYIDQDGILNQELEGLVPIRYYHKLEQEFGEAKEQLAQQKDYIARCDEVIKVSINEIRVRDTTIRNLSTELAKYKAGAARNVGN